jgi:superfamily I DNA and/or RNA helicase
MQHYFRRLKRHITVGTVDGFQGQERDVIVISLVRDNAEGNIGFLRDLRRMNVAITRARMKLIIVGNAQTLSRHRFYRALAEHIRQQGEMITIPPEQEQNTQP